MSPLCVIFDLDGTLVDSEGICQQGYLNLIPELEDTIENMVRTYRGVNFESICADLEKRIGRPLEEDFEHRYRSHVAEELARSLRPVPGALEMLARLSHPSCVASNGPLHKMRLSLASCGLASHFGERIFSAHEVRSWKPEPGLFLHAASEMGYSPEQCVVVEDSEVGISAAQAAGMIALLYAPGQEDDTHADEALQFGALQDLPELLADIAAYKKKWGG